MAARWAVQFEHTARPKRIQTKIFRLLERAELAGYSQIGSRYGMPMHNEARALGIWSAIDIGDRNGKVYVVPGPSGWWGDHGHVTDGLLVEAERNEEKLRSAPAPRHLVIWVDYAAIAATIEMTERGPSQDPVQLPSYVDVAWALCGEADLNGVAIWRAEDGQTWSVLRSSRSMAR